MVSHAAPTPLSFSRAFTSPAPVIATQDRLTRAKYGAVVGAAAGALLGLAVHEMDNTGEGFNLPTMIGGGAVLGALIGSLAGFAWPSHHDPASYVSLQQTSVVGSELLKNGTHVLSERL